MFELHVLSLTKGFNVVPCAVSINLCTVSRRNSKRHLPIKLKCQRIVAESVLDTTGVLGASDADFMVLAGQVRFGGIIPVERGDFASR